MLFLTPLSQEYDMVVLVRESVLKRILSHFRLHNITIFYSGELEVDWIGFQVTNSHLTILDLDNYVALSFLAMAIDLAPTCFALYSSNSNPKIVEFAKANGVLCFDDLNKLLADIKLDVYVME